MSVKKCLPQLVKDYGRPSQISARRGRPQQLCLLSAADGGHRPLGLSIFWRRFALNFVIRGDNFSGTDLPPQM